MEKKDITIPFWKRVWQTVTVQNGNRVEEEVVMELLDLVGEELCKGLTVYKSYNVNEFEPWAKKMRASETNVCFENFFSRVCQKLNLDPSVTWTIMCNFLMYEYYGKISDIKELSKYESGAIRLIENIWNFYTTERMFLLKTIRHVLNQYFDEKSVYHGVFLKYINKMTMGKIQENLLNQMEYLINEINISHAGNCINMKDWLDRNNREQLEVVLSIILTMQSNNFTMRDYIRMLELFVKHDFASSPSYIQNVCIQSPSFRNVNSAELGAFLVGLEKCWENPERWLKYEDELDKLLMGVAKIGDHSVIMLTWATLHASLTTQEAMELYNKNYSRITFSALEGSVFKSLYDIARNAGNFDITAKKLILRSIFTLYNKVCDYFNENDFIFVQDHAVELLDELFKDEDLAKHCFQTHEPPIKSIFIFALKLFPYDFHHLTTFATTLVQHGAYAKKVMKTLDSLSAYTEVYLNRISDGEIVSTSSDYFPVPSSKLIKFQRGTEAVGMQKFGVKFLVFKSTYSYFNVLMQQVELLMAEIHSHRTINERIMKKVLAGYNLISHIFRHCDVNDVDKVEVQGCLKVLDKIVLTFTNERFKNLELIKMFFEVVTAVAVSDYHLKIQIWNTPLLPKVLKHELNIKDLFNEVTLSRGVITNVLIEEEHRNNHELLLVYIEYVKNAVNKNIYFLEIQIPGLMYIIRNVFPHHWEWDYENESQKYRITNECLQILLTILTQNPKTVDNPYQKMIFEFCLEGSLHDEFIVKGYINLLKLSNFFIQKELETETDWTNGTKLVHIRNLKTLLRLLLLLMKYNRLYKKDGASSVFEKKLMYSVIQGTSTIKIIAGYIQQPLDILVPKLAIRVMQNFAMDSTLPLFGPLELDNFQLQSFFLERLRDPVEDEELKLAIIDFINVAIERQPGLTGAFFNVKGLSGSYDTQGKALEGGESVASFMIDYLVNMKKSPETLRSPLQFAILEVIHKLWDNHKVALVKDMVDFEEFWMILANPIFHRIKLDNKLYGMIFGILSLEILHKQDKVSREFKDVLTRFFDLKTNHLKKWMSHLTFISESQNLQINVDQFNKYVASPELYLLNAWKAFIVLTNKHLPSFFDEPEVRALISETCLDGLIHHLSSPEDLRVSKIWSEIFLMCLKRWNNQDLTNIGQLFTKFTNVLELVLKYYTFVDGHCKQTVLASASRIILCFDEFLSENSSLVQAFLAPLGKIIDIEYESLEVTPGDSSVSYEVPPHLINWVLVLSIGNNLLLLEDIEAHSMWFDSFEFLKRTMACIGLFMKNTNTVPVARIAVQSLIAYARSPLAKDFLRTPMISFYAEIVPHADYVNHAKINEKSAPVVREWWATYGEILKLHSVLIQRFGTSISKECFSLIYVHDEILASSLTLTNITVDPAAMSLVCLCLQFLSSMFEWRDTWTLMNKTSFFRIMCAIQEAVNSIINILLRPKLLMFFTVEEKSKVLDSTYVQEEALIDTLNMLIEIITLSFSCFLNCDPELLTFLDCYIPNKSFFDVKIDFHVPKYNSYDSAFTYGGLICLLQFLCKSSTKLPSGNQGSRDILPQRKMSQELVGEVRSQQYIGLIKQDNIEHLPYDKLNTIQRFAASGFSFLEVPWLKDINETLVHVAIEKLSTFLAIQIFLDVNNPSVPASTQQYLKREFYSELQFFTEFVKKRMNDQLFSSGILALKVNRRNDNESDVIRLSKYLGSRINLKYWDIENEYLYCISHWFSNICHLNN